MLDSTDRKNAERAKKDGFVAKHGLLYDKVGNLIPLPMADSIAQGYDFIYVERLVKALQILQQATGSNDAA